MGAPNETPDADATPPAIDAAAALPPSVDPDPRVDATTEAVFPRAVIDPSVGSALADEQDVVASFGDQIVGVVDRIGISAEEMVAVPLADRVALLLDAPRSELLRSMAERMARAPEEIVIEALDRLFDDR